MKKFEEELAQLEQLKKAAQSRKEKARIRELEMQRLLKEAVLKQARLRKEAAKRKVELRAKAEEEARRNKEEMRRREKERKERLAYLKLQAQRLREELGSPARALGLDAAVYEIKCINRVLLKMEVDFAKELEAQLKPLREYHGQKIVQAEKIEPRDKMFETEADYRARVSKQTDLVQSLQAELTAKEQQIKNQLMAELAAQKNPLMEQMHRISEQEFTLGAEEVKFKLQQYVPEEEEFAVYVELRKPSRKSFLFLAFLPVPKAKARDYWHHPGLLVPEVTMGVKSPGIIFPKKVVFYGPEGAAYVPNYLTGLLTGSEAREISRDGTFIATGTGVVIDTKTGLIWAAKDNGKGISWHDAKRYCENYQGDGYGGWRMPTQDELEGLFDRSRSYQAKQGSWNVHLTELIQLTTCSLWASETHGSRAATFHFYYGARYWIPQSYSSSYRALPVRAGN